MEAKDIYKYIHPHSDPLNSSRKTKKKGTVRMTTVLMERQLCKLHKKEKKKEKIKP